MSYLNLLTEKNINAHKKPWLDNEGKNHWLAHHAQIIDDFKETSCEMTATIIRHMVSKMNDWTPISGSFTEIEKLYPIFQVSYSESQIDDIEHIITVCTGKIIQSYFRKYTYSCRDITDQDRKILNKKDKVTKEDYKCITGVQLKEELNVYLFFWVP